MEEHFIWGSIIITLILVGIFTADIGLGFDSEILEKLRDKYHILHYIIAIGSIAVIISFGMLFSAGPDPEAVKQRERKEKEEQNSSYPEKGYWGDDGYYNPSQAEMQESIREAEEWIKNN